MTFSPLGMVALSCNNNYYFFYFYRIPNFNIPFCFDIHYSPVTSLVYCGNCPDDFIAQLHSVKSKLPHNPASTKVIIILMIMIMILIIIIIIIAVAVERG